MAALAVGTSKSRIFICHALPNIMPPIIILVEAPGGEGKLTLQQFFDFFQCVHRPIPMREPSAL